MFRQTTSTPRLAHEWVTVRHSRPEDAEAIARLAALDSKRPPTGPALVAESDARLLAALPMGSGGPVADPFDRTGELVDLLALRRAQLAESDPRPRGLKRRLRSALRHRPAAA